MTACEAMNRRVTATLALATETRERLNASQPPELPKRHNTFGHDAPALPDPFNDLQSPGASG